MAGSALVEKELTFADEDHTMGTLLQAYIEQDVPFAAYRQTHPLNREIKFRIAVAKPGCISSAMKKGFDAMEADLMRIVQQTDPSSSL